MPLAVGNYWTYYDYQWQTSDINSFHTTDTVTQLILDKILLGDRYWYKKEQKGSYQFVLAVNKDDGYWTANSFNSLDTNLAYLYAKYPVIAGDKFYFAVENDTMVVVKMDTSVIVPAGTFQCIYYALKNFDDGTYWSKFFIQPGVGIVKREFIDYFGIDSNGVVKDTFYRAYQLAGYGLH
jgi:hypothetical protein